MNLKDLSKTLGLSPTTVSRALNGYPEVSEGTRQRVLEAARLHKYAPSHTARGLATGKTGTVGHIIPLGLHRMINPHFSDFIAGAGQSYAKLGLDIIMSVTAPEDEIGTYIRLAKGNRVDGFVLQGPLVDDPRIALMREMNVPFVVHGRAGLQPGQQDRDYSWLDVDNLDAFDRATRYLIDLGHHRIALLNGLEHMHFAHERRAGFERAMQDASLACDPKLMYSEDMSEAYGYETTQHLISTDKPPTAILTASKLIATGCQRALHESGLQAPKDISLLTYDDDFGFFGTGARVPAITCVRSSLFAAGEKVSKMIATRIADPNAPADQILWQADLILGRSTGRAPQ